MKNNNPNTAGLFDDLSPSLLSCFGIFTACCIGAVNLPVLWVIKKESQTTFINKLVGVDCFLCLCNIPIVIYTADVFGFFNIPSLCGLNVTTSFIISMLNRLLPVGIVFYRYVYVCKSSWVLTAQQRKNVNLFICSIIVSLTVVLSLCSFLYKEKYLIYLKCMGEEDKFPDPQANVKLLWLLPLYHPFHLLSIITFFSHTLLAPLGYFIIYVFRQKLDCETKGINESSRIARKNRNIVTTKFNFLIWLSEASSVFVLVPKGKTFFILYFLISSCVTPILYYIGIEVNRQAVKTRLRELLKESKTRGNLPSH